MQAVSRDASVSSDIGNAYSSFEKGRKYPASGLFGPCEYGLPSIFGAKIASPDVSVVGFAGDRAFAISVNEMAACGRGGWPAITTVIFRNDQRGAEKRNKTLWFEDNCVGTELNLEVENAKVVEGYGLKGVQVRTMPQLPDVANTAMNEQMQDTVTTFIEGVLIQDSGGPFRRDAVKQSTKVAGISLDDMQPQKVA